MGEADCLKAEEVKFSRGGLIPEPNLYSGVEDVSSYLARIFSFMNELLQKYKGKDVNILISGHKCTTGSVSAYLEGVPEDGNFFKLSVKNAEYKVFKL